MGRVEILTWDYREQPDFTRLAAIVDTLSGRRVHLAEADTRSDQYALAFSTEPIDEHGATEAYEAWCDGGGSS